MLRKYAGRLLSAEEMSEFPGNEVDFDSFQSELTDAASSMESAFASGESSSNGCSDKLSCLNWPDRRDVAIRPDCALGELGLATAISVGVIGLLVAWGRPLPMGVVAFAALAGAEVVDGQLARLLS